MKISDNIRCIRKYEKKDGSISFHAEVRRKNAKPLRESFRTLTDAKNWVRKMESTILDGKHVLDNKARKITLSDLIEKYIGLHLSKFPSRLKDQISHLNWWNEPPTLSCESCEKVAKTICGLCGDTVCSRCSKRHSCVVKEGNDYMLMPLVNSPSGVCVGILEHNKR